MKKKDIHSKKDKPIKTSKQNKTKIVLFAGNGDLPRIVAKELQKQQRNFEIFCFIEDGNKNQQKNTKTSDKNHINNNYEFFVKNGLKPVKISIADITDIIKKLKKVKAKEVVCCGGLTFQGLNFLKLLNWNIVKCLLKVLFVKVKGDNFLLSLANNILEGCGCKVIGVQEIIPDILCKKSDNINVRLCKKQHFNDAKLGLEVLKHNSKYDIGQAIIVQNGRVLAIEGAEGTAELLKRSKNYKKSASVNSILVKTIKTGQNMKFDVPAIGIETFKLLENNGFDGIVVENGCVILMDREKVKIFCQKHNIFLMVV